MYVPNRHLADSICDIFTFNETKSENYKCPYTEHKLEEVLTCGYKERFEIRQIKHFPNLKCYVNIML